MDTFSCNPVDIPLSKTTELFRFMGSSSSPRVSHPNLRLDTGYRHIHQIQFSADLLSQRLERPQGPLPAYSKPA